MNLMITGALLGTLLLPFPAFSPAISPGAPADRVSVAHGWPDPPQREAVWPLRPRPEIAQRFDPPTRAWSAGHRGVDLLGAPGARVRTALSGTVTFAGTVAGRGVVVVTHGSFRATYEPVRTRVRRGDHLRAGAVIGTLASGRSHCVPRTCLHWGLITADGYRDPLSLLPGARRVRLLPLDSDQARGWARW